MTKASNRRSKAAVSILTTVLFVGSQILVPIPAAFAAQPTAQELAIPRTPEVPVTEASSQIPQPETETRYRYGCDPATGLCVDPPLRRPEDPGIPPMPDPRDPGVPEDRPIVIPPPQDPELPTPLPDPESPTKLLLPGPISPGELDILMRETGRVIRFEEANWIGPDPIIIDPEDGEQKFPEMDRVFHFSAVGPGVAELVFHSASFCAFVEPPCLTPEGLPTLLPTLRGKILVEVVEGPGIMSVQEVVVQPGVQTVRLTRGNALRVLIPTLPGGWILTEAHEYLRSEPRVIFAMRFGPGELQITSETEPIILEEAVGTREILKARVVAGGEILKSWEIRSWDPPTPRRRSLNVVTTDGAKISFSPGGMYRMDQTLASEVYGSLKKTAVVELRRTRTGFRLLTRASLLYASVPIILRSGRLLPRQQWVQYESFKYDQSGNLELTRALRRTADGTTVQYRVNHLTDSHSATVIRRNERQHYDFANGTVDVTREEPSGLLRRISGMIQEDPPKPWGPIYLSRIPSLEGALRPLRQVQIEMHHHQTTVTETEILPRPLPDPGLRPIPEPEPPVQIRQAPLGWSSAILLASRDSNRENPRHRRIR